MPPKKSIHHPQTHENFWEKIRAIYFHAISFVGIVLLVIGAIMGINLGLKIVFNIEEPYQRNIYLERSVTTPLVGSATMEKPRNFTVERAELCVANPENTKCQLSDAELDDLEMRLAENRYILKYNRYRDLITSSSFLVVGAILVFLHRRKIYV